MEARRRARGPLRALFYGAVAIVLHFVGLGLVALLAAILPTPKLDETPQEVEVTWIESPSQAEQDIKLPEAQPEQAPPDVAAQPPERAQAVPPPPPPRPPEAPKPPPPKPPEVAKVKPPEPPKVEPPKPQPPKPKPPEKKPESPTVALIPKPKPPTPPPQPPPPEQKQQQKPPVQNPHMKKVEVDDEKDVVAEPPPEAAYLSDKNRRVQQETRDTRTNLEKTEKGKASASEKSEDTQSEDVGGKEQDVHQLEKSVASTLEKKNLPPTAHDGKKDDAKGVLVGEKGDGGKGEGGNRGEGGKPGALAMRNIEGRGAPGGLPSMSVAPSGANDDAPAVAQSETPGGGGPAGRPGREGKAGKEGRRGNKMQLTMDDYERIVGQDKLHDEAELAQRQTSHKKGRWEKKMEQIHAALENFTPEVKPGNQTALGTRAAPFAVFIARMHRKIHELWGFGYLEELDGKSMTDPMNDRKLEVTLEIVLNGDGTLDKATIARPSGQLTFDVAAIDTVQNAGPFENPPEVIRSANGKVYLHWTFHRDERQCSPYFADPFILDNPGPGQERGLPDPTNAIAEQHRQRRAEKIGRNASPTEGGVMVPHMTRPDGAEGDAARANINTPAPDDPEAQKAAMAWLDGFEAGSIDRLVAASGVPFSSGGDVVANDPATLAKVWRAILEETPTRNVKEWKVLTASGYRALFGRLPKGGESGTNRFYLAARVGKDWVTLDILPDGGGKFVVRGFTR